MADILSLICCVGEALLVGNVLERIRLVGCILLYLTSMFAVGSGLIGLMDEDDKTQELVQKLQSAGVTHLLEGGPGLGRDGRKCRRHLIEGVFICGRPFCLAASGREKLPRTSADSDTSPEEQSIV
ncbi:hypothetical protein BV898_10142 [Hypsibius exemplaris]|uniref:Uncharacterized protein n=1 Tax=Hypsibius exemplaris TaxID=2072580 RepID=A0A1W0WKE7_HYPEX|nr:hypothetical protein BV898_10142 [Hypsibius exemplaris]